MQRIVYVENLKRISNEGSASISMRSLIEKEIGRS